MFLDTLNELPVFDQKSAEERAIIWKFRHFQSTKAHLLPKFLVAVDWSKSETREEAIDMMPKWAQIGLQQVLSMLSGLFGLNNDHPHISVLKTELLTSETSAAFLEIRKHAVEALKFEVPEEQLELILLQLVQALRYEDTSHSSGLRTFLFDKATSNQKIAHSLFWSLKLEAANEGNSKHICAMFQQV